MDGVGEYETLTISSFSRKSSFSQKLFSKCLPISLGLYYSAITSYLGFKINEGEYKVMGLSGYGKPTFYEKLKKVFWFEGGQFTWDEGLLDYSPLAKRLYTKELENLLGIPPAKDKKWVEKIADDIDIQVDKSTAAYCNLACSAQKLLTEIQINIIKYAIQISGINNICVAGGVALNTLANMEIDKLTNHKYFVFPPSGDAGSALGAAFLGFNKFYEGQNIFTKPKHYVPFLGSEYSDQDYRKSILDFKKVSIYDMHVEKLEKSGYVKWICDRLVQKKIVPIHIGRSEYGPRALGNRSLFAAGRFDEMKQKINCVVKKREAYRPYAPAIAKELVPKSFPGFDLSILDHPSHPLSYMACR